MNYELLFKKAKAANIENLEVYEALSANKKLTIFESQVDSFTTNVCLGISVRGIYEKKVGNTFIEIDDDETIDEIINQIKQNASAITTKEEVLFNEKKENYLSLPLYSEQLNETDINDVIVLLKKVEKALLNADARIDKVSTLEFDLEKTQIHIKNTFGLDASRLSNQAYIFVECVAKENNDIQSTFNFEIIKNLKDLDIDTFVKHIAKEVCDKLNASKVLTSRYPTIILNRSMANILELLIDSFSADNVQKGISVYTNKLNTKLYDERVSFIEDPHMLDGLKSTPFDDEGVPTYKKAIVENGVLKTYLHNLLTAKKDHVAPTGNGFKAGYSAPINIACTNLYLEKGTLTYDELVKKMQTGIIITDVTGLNAGLNTLTLDFSLQASGFYVENGKIVKPINLITVAGNINEMLSNITEIGNDLKFELYGIGSPSVLFNSLQISGD